MVDGGQSAAILHFSLRIVKRHSHILKNMRMFAASDCTEQRKCHHLRGGLENAVRSPVNSYCAVRVRSIRRRSWIA